jgi:hypothetical protein
VRASVLALAMLSGSLAAVGDAAGADEAVVRASALYEAGRQAHERGEHRTAVLRFVEADRLVPAPAALEAALTAALAAEDPALGMEVVDRAARVGDDPRLAELRAELRRKSAARAGRVVVRCDDCSATVGGVAMVVGQPRWVRVGRHSVVLSRGGAQERRSVVVEPGVMVELFPSRAGAPVAPSPAGASAPPAGAPAEMEPSGIAPGWLWVGAGLTALATTGAIISGVDTLARHDDFEAEPSVAAARDGEAAETRTNVFIGVAAGLAVTTVLLAAFAVDWGDGEPEPRAGVAVGPTGGHVRVRF